MPFVLRLCRKYLVLLVLLAAAMVLGTGLAWAQSPEQPAPRPAGEEDAALSEQSAVLQEQAGEEDAASLPEQSTVLQEQAREENASLPEQSAVLQEEAAAEEQTVRVAVYASGARLLFEEEVGLQAGEVTLPGGEVYRYEQPTALAALALALEQKGIPWAVGSLNDGKEIMQLAVAPGPWDWFLRQGAEKIQPDKSLKDVVLSGGDGLVVYPWEMAGRLLAEPPGSASEKRGAAKPSFHPLALENQGPEVEWEKTLWGSYSNCGYSVQQTTDGGYIIAGGTYSFSAGGDVYLVKTDASGNEQWAKTLGGSDEEWGNSVQQTADGGYIIAGDTYSFGANDQDVYLVKTDASGNEQWEKTFGGSYWDCGYSVQQTADGGYIIAGITYSFSAGGDVYLVKTDASGNEQWEKTFGGSSWDEGDSVQQTADGGYIIAGVTSSFGAGGDDVYLIKLKGETALPNQPPIASFTYFPANPVVGEEITFDASDSRGSITNYKWDFGDGSEPVEGADKITVTHSYSSEENYTVTLTVTDDEGTTNSKSQIVTVKRPPVILVHGYCSSPATWDTMVSFLKGNGYNLNETLFTIDLAPGLEVVANGNIITYADRLATKVEEVKQIADADKVDIVAHSMGGLVSRWYIEMGEGNKNVRKLIILGTPNHGDELLLERYQMYWLLIMMGEWIGPSAIEAGLGEAGRQMTPGSYFLKALNTHYLTNYYELLGTEYFTIAGNQPRWYTNQIFQKYPPSENDGLVRVVSVELDDIPLQTYTLDHSDLPIDDAVLHKVLEILVGNSHGHPSMSARAMQQTQGATPTQEAPLISDRISSGEQKSYEIAIGATTEATFTLAWLEGDLNLTLTTPSGTLIDPSAAESDPNITCYREENLTIEGYTVQDPEPGVWRVNIAAVDVPEEGEEYTVMTFLETTVTLSVNLAKYQYDPGEEINIAAELKSGETPLSGASVIAKIQRPDELAESLTLYDDGLHNDNKPNDGVYAHAYANTTTWGTYDVTVTASGTINEEQFEREAFATVWVEQYPDLMLDTTDISFSDDNPSPDDNITINATIHNIGEADANNASILFYDGEPARGEPIGEGVVNVTANGTVDAPVSWTASAGTHEIYVLVSPYNEFLEESYTNNMANKSIKVTPEVVVTPQPDLTVTNISTPDNIPAGREATVTAAVYNSGSMDADSFEVAFYAGGEMVNTQTVSSLVYGASTETSFTWTPTIPGEVTLKVVADSNNVITEANETNNELTKMVTVETVLDTTPPRVVTTEPADDAAGISVDKTISVTFSEEVQAGDSYNAITLQDAGNNDVAFSKAIEGQTLTIDPAAYLAYGTTYTVTIPAGAVEDLAGNALVEDDSFSFTTGAAPAGDSGAVTGKVVLQGQPADGAGVTIKVEGMPSGPAAISEASGEFRMEGIPAGTYTLSFSYPGYLVSKIEVTVTAGETAVLEADVILRAGDVNDDNRVDLQDLTLLASAYRSQQDDPTTGSRYNPAADLNADGQVNLQDLTLLATNYRQVGD